jgi:hypothetical protein
MTALSHCSNQPSCPHPTIEVERVKAAFFAWLLA